MGLGVVENGTDGDGNAVFYLGLELGLCCGDLRARGRRREGSEVGSLIWGNRRWGMRWA